MTIEGQFREIKCARSCRSKTEQGKPSKCKFAHPLLFFFVTVKTCIYMFKGEVLFLELRLLI